MSEVQTVIAFSLVALGLGFFVGVWFVQYADHTKK